MKILPKVDFLKNIELSVLLCLFVLITGCVTATHDHDAASSQTTTVHHSDNNGGVVTSSNTAVPVTNTATTTSTTSTTNTTAVHHEGVIGSVFHAIGAVLAFPFILIGNVIQAIF
jgi:hypothetical protein